MTTMTLPALDASATRYARRYSTRLESIIRRQSDGTLTGRNVQATANAAYRNLVRLLVEVIRLEDTHGVDAAADLSQRATRQRQGLTALGLINLVEVGEIEREALAIVEATPA